MFLRNILTPHLRPPASSADPVEDVAHPHASSERMEAGSTKQRCAAALVHSLGWTGIAGWDGLMIGFPHGGIQ
jgi:hypothetical protein